MSDAADLRRNPAERLELPFLSAARGDVVLPGSKSISIRALLLASLARGRTTLSGVLESDDTAVMCDALARLKVPLVRGAPGEWVIDGAPVFPCRDCDIFVGNSGLSARTLIALLAFMPGRYRFHGTPRMHQRPIGDLVAALRGAGAQVVYLGKDGFLPLEVTEPTAPPRTAIRVKGSASSQFLTGLLQAAPLLTRASALRVAVDGELISRGYVALTLDIMRRFGVAVGGDPNQSEPVFAVEAGACYESPGCFRVEGDASSASYFLALGLLGGGPVRVTGVAPTSLQADIRFVDVLAQMGARIATGPDWIEASSPGVATGFRLLPIDQDLNHIPDAAMTVAVLALYAAGPSTLRNIGSWRVKETDRLAAMATELTKLGARVALGPDFLRIEPPARLGAAPIETYDDHRMAMAFSLAAFGAAGVTIIDPGCVAKTFPDYFRQFATLTSGGAIRS